ARRAGPGGRRRAPGGGGVRGGGSAGGQGPPEAPAPAGRPPPGQTAARLAFSAGSERRVFERRAGARLVTDPGGAPVEWRRVAGELPAGAGRAGGAALAALALLARPWTSPLPSGAGHEFRLAPPRARLTAAVGLTE